MGIIADKEIMTLSHELPNNFARALARLSWILQIINLLVSLKIRGLN
jgi:hypothetical protein